MSEQPNNPQRGAGEAADRRTGHRGGAEYREDHPVAAAAIRHGPLSDGRGTSCSEGQRRRQARQAYEQAIAADPRAVAPVVALTRLDASEGKLAAALARLEERLARDPAEAVFLSASRGTCSMTMQKPVEAVESYSAAIKQTPGWTQPYRGLAAALITAGQPEKAADALAAGIKATGGSRELVFDAATLYSQLGRVDEVFQYPAALQRNPGDNVVADDLAILLSTQRSDRSLERAERLTERFKDYGEPAFLDTYGWVAFKRGKYAEAEAALRKRWRNGQRRQSSGITSAWCRSSSESARQPGPVWRRLSPRSGECRPGRSRIRTGLRWKMHSPGWERDLVVGMSTLVRQTDGICAPLA